MFQYSGRLALGIASAVAIAALAANADQSRMTRGKYLVEISGCNDCHTPGYFLGKPDTSRYLGGSDVGFEIPGQGVFVGPNITPDETTGIGGWTPEQVVKAIQAGERPDGRILSPIMPWHAFATLTADDAAAIAAFLRTVRPVKNKPPGPFKAGETVSTFMFRIVPPGGTAAAAN